MNNLKKIIYYLFLFCFIKSDAMHNIAKSNRFNRLAKTVFNKNKFFMPNLCNQSKIFLNNRNNLNFNQNSKCIFDSKAAKQFANQKFFEENKVSEENKKLIDNYFKLKNKISFYYKGSKHVNS